MGDIAAKHDNQALQLGKLEDDAVLDRSSTSATSTPEGDHDRDAEPDHGAEVEAQGQPQQQKRKGGRKPVSKFPLIRKNIPTPKFLPDVCFTRADE